MPDAAPAAPRLRPPLRLTVILFALAASSGLLQVLVFPRFSYATLAAVAVAPLLLALAQTPSAKRRFLLGWLAGCIYWGGTCYWVYGVMHDYAGIAAAGAGAIFIGFFLAKGLHLAVFSVLAGPLLGRPWAVPAVAALWTAVEGTHQYLGFTWLHLGNAAASMSTLAALAPFTGVYGPSFVLIMINTALAIVALRRPRFHLLWLLPLPLLLLLPSLPEGEIGERAVRLVQPNIHPGQMIGGWTPQQAAEHLRRMAELSSAEARRIDPARPELLIWPEYSVPAYFFESDNSRRYFETIAEMVNAHFIFNTIAFEERGGQRRPLNSAVTLDPEGQVLSHYSKMHLVPFGEFVPWPFSLFIDKITLEAGDFAPGRKASVAPVGENSAATFICYESAFVRAVRRFVANGAKVLVNISNDAWYGRSSARYQHLLLARMRAIENQRWILRATNDGVTTVINRAGQIFPPLPEFEDGVLAARFNYESDLTWFTRFGQWFLWSCFGWAALFLLAETRPPGKT